MAGICAHCDRPFTTTNRYQAFCDTCLRFMRPENEEPPVDYREIPGTVSFRRHLAREKGHDE